MRTLVFLLALSTAVISAGCARDRRDRPPEPARESRLANLPFVYRMTVQQGNIVNEDMIDQLQFGMTRNQVLYVLGTPMLADMFHTNRWDYTYTIRRGHQPMEVKPLTLWFENDQLARIDGPQPRPARAEAALENRELVVTVPDWQDNRGLFRRTLNALGGDNAPPERQRVTAPDAEAEAEAAEEAGPLP